MTDSITAAVGDPLADGAAGFCAALDPMDALDAVYRGERRALWRAAVIAFALHAAVIMAAALLGPSDVWRPTGILAVMELADYDPEGGEPGGGPGPALGPPPAPEPVPADAPPEEAFVPEPEPEVFEDDVPALLETVSEKIEETAPPPPPPAEAERPRERRERRDRPRREPTRGDRLVEASAGGGAAGAAVGGGGGGEGQGRGGHGGGTGRGTRDPLAAYVTRVTRRLEHGKRYPSAARNAGLQGRAVVVITVNSNGRVLSASLVQSSGHQSLDDEVLSLVRRVDPLPNFPPELDRQQLTLRVPLDFRLR